MKRYDIDKKFSELVGLYIADGWTIHTMSMCGHQGEEGKVDLTKDDELIRIWLSSESTRNWRNPEEFHGNIMYLRVGRWNYPAHSIRDSFSTAWMRDFYIFQELKFYEISRQWYVEDLEEAIQSQNKRHARYMSKVDYGFDDRYSAAHKEIASRYMKRVHGYQRISQDKIRVEKCYSNDRQHACFKVIYNGTCYNLK